MATVSALYDKATSWINAALSPSNEVAKVFGAAPSLSMMKKMNKNKTIFYLPAFWYHYRAYYYKVFPTLWLIFMIVALAGWNTVEGHLVLGSVLSLISSVSVLGSYVCILPWRKHPSSLILYRAMTSIIFSINIIANAVDPHPTKCRNYAVTNEVMLLAGEGWLTTIAIDLVQSLTNPFTSYKYNMKKYTLMVWTFAGFLSFIFFFNEDCQGSFDRGICWVKITSTNAPCLWGYFLFWIVCMYAYQMWAAVFAYMRLRKGLPLTFEIRKQCAIETYKCLSVYAAYLSVMMFFFAIISSSNPNPVRGSSLSNFSLFLLFVIANRGSVDGAVWFMLHDFMREGQEGSSSNSSSSIGGTSTKEGRAAANEEHGDDGVEGGDDGTDDGTDAATRRARATSIDRIMGLHKLTTDIAGTGQVAEEAVKKGMKSMGKGIKGLADLAIAEFDENELSPQVNMALRTQIVQYVTSGVRNAVRRLNLVPPPRPGLGDLLSGKFQPKKDTAVTPGLEVLEFLLEGEHPFKAFAPGVFQELRSNEGIDDERFLKVLSSTANERLSEGASGAFMFFCGGGEFIVKTIRAREAKVLHQSLGTYHAYLKKNKNSLLCRFLGSYSLSMYAQTFYFVVMLNCFDPKADIQERFDIKGSWVGRSADPAKATKKVVCRHCNSYFVPAAKEQCTVIVGKHEANVVLKDNDLHTKISLAPFEAHRVLDILKKDSELLGEMGVLDYSLLVGVKKKRFAVEVSDEELGLQGESDADADAARNDDDDDSGGFDAAATTRSGMAAISTFRAVSVTGPAIYYLGIVDFLQDWTTNKKFERTFKIYALRKDPDGLSVMQPEKYKLRFQAKMEQIFDTEGPPAAMGRSWSASNAKALADAAHRVHGSGASISGKSPEDNVSSIVVNPLQQSDERR